jgi:hypothetical protein
MGSCCEGRRERDREREGVSDWTCLVISMLPSALRNEPARGTDGRNIAQRGELFYFAEFVVMQMSHFVFHVNGVQRKDQADARQRDTRRVGYRHDCGLC